MTTFLQQELELYGDELALPQSNEVPMINSQKPAKPESDLKKANAS